MLGAVIVGSGAVLGVLVTSQDAIEYREILKGNYQTPWYDGRWWRQPFTNFVLSGKLHHIYWTTNANKSQDWLVKETTVEGKTFWTIIERKPHA